MIDINNRIGRGAATALFSAAAILASSSGFAIPRYDGLWIVSIITEKGTCDPGYSYPVRITNGELLNDGGDPFTITGKVMPTGVITVTVSGGGKSALGTGRLTGNGGIGSWSGGECSGTWTAERRGS